MRVCVKLYYNVFHIFIHVFYTHTRILYIIVCTYNIGLITINMWFTGGSCRTKEEAIDYRPAAVVA